MKKFLFAIIAVFSFCFINSGDAIAKKDNKGEIHVINGDGNLVKTIVKDKKKKVVVTKQTITPDGTVIKESKDVYLK